MEWARVRVWVAGETPGHPHTSTRACVARPPAPHPGYTLLGFRVHKEMGEANGLPHPTSGRSPLTFACWLCWLALGRKPQGRALGARASRSGSRLVASPMQGWEGEREGAGLAPPRPHARRAQIAFRLPT